MIRNSNNPGQGKTLKSMKKEGQAHHRVSTRSMLLVSILPLWALWFFSFFSYQNLLSEMETLPRFFGMHLYKEYIRGPLERFAKVVGVLESQHHAEKQEDGQDQFLEHDLERLALLSGVDTPFIVVRLKKQRILYPLGPTYESASFLEESDSRTAFFSTLQRIADNGSLEGYLFIDFTDPSQKEKTGRWFLLAAPAAEDLFCILLVSEKKLAQSGSILQEAQEALLQEKLKQFRNATIPALLLTSTLIGLLHRQRKQPGG